MRTELERPSSSRIIITSCLRSFVTKELLGVAVDRVLNLNDVKVVGVRRSEVRRPRLQQQAPGGVAFLQALPKGGIRS